MFDWISNAPLSGCAVSVGCRQTASAWNLQPQARIGLIKLKELFSCDDLEIPLVLTGLREKGLKRY